VTRLARIVASKKRLTALAVVLVALAAPLAAVGFYSSTGSGTGSANVGTLNAPTNVTLATSTGAVNVNWTASATAGSAIAPTGYYVQRNAGSGWSAACDSTPSSLLTGTSCDDTVTVDGDYTYRAVAVYHSWTATSAASDSAHVTTDTTPPTSSITFPSGSSYNTAGYNAGCSTPSTGDICGTATDPGVGAAGVNKVQVSIQRASDSKYWNGSTWAGGLVWNDATGTTGWTYALDASVLADGVAYTVQSRAIDNAGNAQTTPDSKTFAYDTTAPSVTVNQKAGQADPTNALPIRFTVQFSESVSDFDASDVNRGGTATGGSVAVTGSGQNYEIAVSGLTSNGTVTASIDAGKAHDAAGNANTASAGTDNTVTYTASPFVVSITRAASSPTNAGSVTWTVSFSENVTGVDSADFALVNAGLGGTPAITGVTPAGSSSAFTVTASTGAGSGTLGLNLVDNDSIKNGANQTLGSEAGGANGGFTGQAYVVDRANPTNALSLNVSSGGAFLSGPSLYYKGNAAGSFTIANAVTDSGGSGPASSAFPAISTAGMSHSNETVTTPAGGPYTSSAYSWTTSTFASSHTVTGADAAGNTAGTALTFTVDNSAPTGGALGTGGVTGGFNTTGSYTVTRTDYTADAGSGVAASVLVRDQAPLVNNTCGTFTNPQTIAGTPPAQNGAAGITSGNCYRYTLTGSDNVGNSVSVTTTVQVDTAPPTNSLSLIAQTGGSFLDLGNNIVFYRGGTGNSGSFKIQNAVADADSGPASSQTAALGGTTTGWTHSAGTVSSPAGGPYVSNLFSWAAGTTSSPTEVVTGRDAAGNATSAPTLTFKNDAAGPTGGAVTVNGLAATGGGSTSFDTDASFTITALTQYSETASTTASGLASSVLVRDEAPLANNSCGATWANPTTILGTPTQNSAAGISTGNCYRYTLTGTDNVGNTASVSTIVKVDTVAPSTTITLNPTTPNGSAGWYKTAAPTFTLAATDPTSGVASRSYQIDGGPTQTYTAAVTITDGSHTISYWSQDNAGNVETARTTSAIKVDTVAPTNAITLAASPTGAFLSGSTLYFKSNAAGSFALVNTVTDAGSGPASATFPAVTASNWTHPNQTTTTPDGGPYTSSTYSWTSGAGTPVAAERTFTSADVAGNPSGGSVLTFQPDSAAPSGGAVTVNGASANGSAPVTVNTSGSYSIASLAQYTEPQTATAAGLASSLLVRDQAPLSTDGTGTCGSYSSPTTISANRTENSSTGITTGNCYRYTLTGADNVGNTASISTIVKVDTTPPSAPALALTAAGSFAFTNGTTAYYNGSSGASSSIAVTATSTDGESGIQKINFPTLTGFAGGGDDTSSPFGATYTWTSSNDSGSKSVTATNGIGTAGTAATFSLVRDVTAPSGGALTVNGVPASSGGSTSTVNGSLPIILRTDYAEAQSATQSGLNASTLTVQSATLTSGTCGAPGSGGPFTSPTTITGTTQPSGVVGGFCYVYSLSGTDNVGNAAVVKTTVTANDVFQLSDPGPQTAGAAFSATITAFFNGAPDTSYSGSKSIAFSGPSNAPNGTAPTYPATVAFAGGVGTAPITLYGAGATTLTATEGATTGTSASFTVGAANAQRLWFTSTSQDCSGGSVTVGNQGTFSGRVGPTDAYGNAQTNATGATVNLLIAINPVQGTFNTPPGSQTILNGASQTGADFSEKIPNGNPTITLTAQTSGAGAPSWAPVSCVISK
jgi:hypothetical protein